MKKIAEFYTMYRILIAIVVLLVHTRHHFILCLRSAFYIVLKLSHIMFSLFFSYVSFYFFPLSCRLFVLCLYQKYSFLRSHTRCS